MTTRPSLDIRDGKTLNVETNIVSRNSLSDLLVMHFDGFAIGGGSDWTESDGHIWLDDTSFNSTDWDCSNTRDLVDILKWESQWRCSWSFIIFRIISIFCSSASSLSPSSSAPSLSPSSASSAPSSASSAPSYSESKSPRFVTSLSNLKFSII